MKRLILRSVIGLGCLLPLMGCVVPVEPARPVSFVPSPVVVEPALVVAPPVVVGRRFYRRGYYGRPVYVGRRGYVRRGYARRGYYYR